MTPPTFAPHPFDFPAPVAPPHVRSGVTVWRRIADTLAGEIRDRRYADTGKLPSEAELSARFGVNRHTLRQAVSALQAQGMLRIEQGRGMFVQHELLNYPLARRTRFSENLQRQGLLPGKQLLTARCEPAAERVARELELAGGDDVLLVETLSEANGQPVNLASAWYPAERFGGLLEMLGEGAQTTEILARLGVRDYLRRESRITTQLPGEEAARLLRQSAARPLLCVESVDVDLEGRPVKYGETLFSGDRVQLLVRSEDA
ncbi:phosphonate metabolism transcriptional regulator PhnF [Ramlibacter sp.]|uniref:phosphonate metabolism transcriptional regulator PhnF n=1 Tax=Ramlibacter sp. TaxID=1917967 RepID=UPI0025E8E300|nr:phosphonate metabolism transcriptional regulator PhnF [Ramlibacter sp.]